MLYDPKRWTAPETETPAQVRVPEFKRRWYHLGWVLDIRPVCWSLRNRPEDWTVKYRYEWQIILTHKPSKHAFRYNFAKTRLMDETECSCTSHSSLTFVQCRQFRSAAKSLVRKFLDAEDERMFREWVRVDRQFRNHFLPPSS